MRIVAWGDEKEIRDMFAEEIGKLCPKADFHCNSREKSRFCQTKSDIQRLDIQMMGKNGVEKVKETKRQSLFL